MNKVSILIPSRNEVLLEKTVEDIFTQATGEIEVIVVLDGPTTFSLPKERKNLTFLRKPKPEGLRSAINDAAKKASGKYIMKADSHCSFGKGFDEILQADMEDDWISVPRRYTLDAELWKPDLDTAVDYYYLGCPWASQNFFMMRDMRWGSKDGRKTDPKYDIDDQMTYGGSVWFTSAKHYKRLGGMNPKGYGQFSVEQQEMGLKTWLGGGRVIINKKTWYAHYGPRPGLRSSFHPDDRENLQGCIYSAHYWTENKWKERKHDFDWLIEKFWPLPTLAHHSNRERHFWIKNWRDYYEGELEWYPPNG